MSEPLIIEIPGTPDRALSPNRTGGHWGKRHKARHGKGGYFDAAYWSTYNAVPMDYKWPAKAMLRLDYVVGWEKGRQPMDDDNVKGLMKVVQDGIASALDFNDKHFTVGTVEQVRDPAGVGFVRVTITPEVEA